MDEGYILVVSPMDDTPGSRAGIRSGDYLISIDGETILGQTMDEALDKLRGPAGEPVTVTVAREGEDLFDVELVREIIQVKPVTWRIEDDDIGYLRVAAFNDRTTDTLEQAIRDMRAELGDGLAGVVVDLRNNPGGLLDQAVGVTDVFLDGGEVVSTRGRNPAQNERYNARPGDMLEGVPVAVLINGGSASASEIVAGAIQDRRRGTVVGMTSFGKGSVQTLIPLRGGRDGALRLTTARYYTPSGRSIQATGIVPDLEVSSRPLDDSRRRLTESDLPNALLNEAEAEGEVEHAIEEPPADYPDDGDFQLERAIDVLRGVDVTQAAAARAG
jgi:carboxyl-terminal processing protease